MAQLDEILDDLNLFITRDRRAPKQVTEARQPKPVVPAHDYKGAAFELAQAVIGNLHDPSKLGEALFEALQTYPLGEALDVQTALQEHVQKLLKNALDSFEFQVESCGCGGPCDVPDDEMADSGIEIGAEPDEQAITVDDGDSEDGWIESARKLLPALQEFATDNQNSVAMEWAERLELAVIEHDAGLQQEALDLNELTQRVALSLEGAEWKDESWLEATKATHKFLKSWRK